MNKKGGNFFEQHVEKIVLALFGLICVWLLATRVLFSPNNVEYQGRKFSCGKIDDHIAKQTDILRGDLESPPKPVAEVYESRIGEYKALLESSVANADVNVNWPIPVVFTGDIIKRYYGIPEIPDVNGISTEHIRAAVYMPSEKIDQENPYSSCDTSINDLDFVTVSANIDIEQLYNNFYENFASDIVKEEWRDPCLAIPVFACVELERQQKLEDGSWSDWQVVPRTKIDLHEKIFEKVEDASELPIGGIAMHLVEYKTQLVQMDILQPGIYDIASPQEQWLPPELHRQYLERRDQAADRERKIKMAEEKEERDRLRKEKKSGRKRTTTFDKGTRGGRGGGAEPGGAGQGGYLVTGGEGRTARREVKEKKTVLDRLREADPITFDDIYDKLDAILLADKKDLSSLADLVFWSHDDTVEPGESYRYRTRVGIFNPIAGTDQFKEEYKPRRNEVVLWSEYSKVSEVVEIPSRLYFFAQSIQEAAKTVTVRVFKYNLGYWYVWDFSVRAGEMIGKVIEKEISETTDQEGQIKQKEDFELPEKIDYSTNAMMVDIAAVKDWGGLRNYSVRPHWEMLYTFDNLSINRIAIGSKYWSDDQREKYKELQKLEKQEKKPYLDRSSSNSERRDMFRRPERNQENPLGPGPGVMNPEFENYVAP